MPRLTAQISGNQIRMNIPSKLVQHAKATFKDLNLSEHGGTHEITNSPENFIACENFLKRILCAEDARVATQALHQSLLAAVLADQGTDDEVSVGDGLPMVPVQAYDLAQASAVSPQLAAMISFLNKQSKEQNLDACGLHIPANVLRIYGQPLESPVLLCRLPSEFENKLIAMASQLPGPSHVVVSEVASAVETYTWHVAQGTGERMTFGIDFDVIERLYVTRNHEGEDIQLAQLIVCAGDTIALGGHCRDKAMADYAAECMQSPNLPSFSNKQIAAMRKKVSDMRSTPLYGKFHPNDSGKFAFLPVFGIEDFRQHSA